MAAVPVTINGVIIDLYGRTIMGPVKIVGEIMKSGVGVGGGPIIPPPSGGGEPPGIWPGPGDPDFPGDGKPPRPPTGIWPGPGDPDYPIKPVPPQVPNVPPPGSPPVIVGGTHPVNPITPPQAVIIEYPGVGKVVVPLPTTTAPDQTPPAPQA